MTMTIRGERWGNLPVLPEPARDATAPSAASAAARGTTGEPSAFAKVLARICDEMDRADASLAAAKTRAAQGAAPAELLVLQADVYRGTEMISLTTKLVDGVASSVRTVLERGA